MFFFSFPFLAFWPFLFTPCVLCCSFRKTLLLYLVDLPIKKKITKRKNFSNPYLSPPHDQTKKDVINGLFFNFTKKTSIN